MRPARTANSTSRRDATPASASTFCRRSPLGGAGWRARVLARAVAKSGVMHAARDPGGQAPRRDHRKSAERWHGPVGPHPGISRPLAPGFSTQTLHQPAAATSLPGKMLQGPDAAPGLAGELHAVGAVLARLVVRVCGGVHLLRVGHVAERLRGRRPPRKASRRSRCGPGGLPPARRRGLRSRPAGAACGKVFRRSSEGSSWRAGTSPAIVDNFAARRASNENHS